MRRRASSTRAPTRRLDSPSRRRWRAGDPYWPRRAEVRSRSWGMRECSRLRRTRAALRPSWSACSPIRAAARASVRPPGGERWSGIRWDGWSGTTPSCWNRSGEKRWVANRASGLQPVLARREHRVRRGGARPRRPRAHHDRAGRVRERGRRVSGTRRGRPHAARGPHEPEGRACLATGAPGPGGGCRPRGWSTGHSTRGLRVVGTVARGRVLHQHAPPASGPADAPRVPPRLAAAYNAATCIVHTRPDEVFSLALLEALACGRPVLAASGGGTPELLGNAGVLAPPENPVVFAGLLRELLGDAPRRASLAVAARQRAVERYSVARMIRDYEEMLEDLV